MADWTKPTITDLYVDVLNYLAAKDSDSATLFLTTPSNQPIGSIRFDRVSSSFQEWDGSVWQNKVISVSGGGTGSNTPAGGAANLGLGTMSLQNAISVAITGGTLQGISFMSLSCSLGFDSDATRNIGSANARPNIIFVRNGLVIPVGANKWVT